MTKIEKLKIILKTNDKEEEIGNSLWLVFFILFISFFYLEVENGSAILLLTFVGFIFLKSIYYYIKKINKDYYEKEYYFILEKLPIREIEKVIESLSEENNRIKALNKVKEDLIKIYQKKETSKDIDFINNKINNPLSLLEKEIYLKLKENISSSTKITKPDPLVKLEKLENYFNELEKDKEDLTIKNKELMKKEDALLLKINEELKNIPKEKRHKYKKYLKPNKNIIIK